MVVLGGEDERVRTEEVRWQATEAEVTVPKLAGCDGRGHEGAGFSSPEHGHSPADQPEGLLEHRRHLQLSILQVNPGMLAHTPKLASISMLQLPFNSIVPR